MADYPDLYSDGFSISAGPMGVTLTFLLSDPSGEPGPHQDQTHPVARLRMSPALADELVRIVGTTMAQAKSGQPSSQTTTKH